MLFRSACLTVFTGEIVKLSILQVPVNRISVSFLIASRKKAEKMFTQCWVPLGEGQSGRRAVSGASLGDRSARAPGALGATESTIFSFHFDLSLDTALPALYWATGAPT